MGASPTIRRLIQRAEDRGTNPFDIPHHVLVGDANDLITLLLQRLIARHIGTRNMGVSIDFHDQRLLRAEEVDDERADHGLAAEFMTTDLGAGQSRP